MAPRNGGAPLPGALPSAPPKAGEQQVHGGAPPQLAGDAGIAPDPAHAPEHLGQSEAGTAIAFGREERVEDPVPDLLRHARARVADPDPDIGPSPEAERPRGFGAIGRADLDRPAARHRVARVDDEVEKRGGDRKSVV